jgi:glyceraldehyde 3-phosphate dehydrogenase
VFDKPEAFTLVHLNDLGSCESTSYLLKFDSVHGTWLHEASAEGEVIVLRGAGREVRVPYSRTSEPAGLVAAYKAAGVQLVLECTGQFLTRATLAPYFDACGVRKVVVSAPVKDSNPVLNVVMGVNDAAYQPCTCVCLRAPLSDSRADRIPLGVSPSSC